MSGPMNPPKRPEPEGPNRSQWSIASLALLVLAILFIVGTIGLMSSQRGANPAAAAGRIFVGIVGCLVAESCTVLGVISGWIGVRRSSSAMGLPRAALALNTALCILLPILVLTILNL